MDPWMHEETLEVLRSIERSLRRLVELQGGSPAEVVAKPLEGLPVTHYGTGSTCERCGCGRTEWMHRDPPGSLWFEQRSDSFTSGLSPCR